MASPAFLVPYTILSFIFTLISAHSLPESIDTTSFDFQIASERILENNNVYRCKNGFYCRLMCTAGSPFTMVLEEKSFFTVALSLTNKDQDLTIKYESSSYSSDIKTKILLAHADEEPITLDTPTGNSWSFVVSGKMIKSYNDGVLILAVDNKDGDEQSTITYRMDFKSEGLIIKIVVPVAAGLLLILIIIAICIYRRKRRQRQNATAISQQNQLNISSDQQPSQSGSDDSLTALNLGDRFPEVKREKLTSSFPQSVCSICLEDLKKGATCRQLYCEHIFHSECIKLWLTNQLKKGHAFCPNCNKTMMNKLENDQDNPDILIQL